jgi:drug/metabolite transporter (DMT)-like permease
MRQILASTAHEQRDYRMKFILAYTAVCLIWGSTYLGVRFAIETLPPLLMAGVRFSIAGIIMFIWAKFAGASLPNLKEARSAAIVGFMLATVCNGLFTLAMGRVPSSIGALIATSLPIWMVLLDWLRPNGVKPHSGVLLGVAVGFGGILLLVQPWNVFLHTTHDSSHSVDIAGAGMMFIGTIGWAVGSIYARQAQMPASPQMNTAVQLLFGGVVMLIWGGVRGEASSVHPENFSIKSLLAFVYLIFFGSIAAFTAYSWLLRNVSAALASSYTYINPIVAIILALTLGGEHITATMLLAMAIILFAVAIIARFRNVPVAGIELNSAKVSPLKASEAS